MPDPGAGEPVTVSGYRTRLMCLRAIMDGRGAEVAVLTAPDSLLWYGGGPGAAALVVTAQGSVAVARRGVAAAGAVVFDGGDPWPAVASVAGRSRAVGCEDLPPGEMARLRAALAPRAVVPLAADIRRQRATG